MFRLDRVKYFSYTDEHKEKSTNSEHNNRNIITTMLKQTIVLSCKSKEGRK